MIGFMLAVALLVFAALVVQCSGWIEEIALPWLREMKGNVLAMAVALVVAATLTMVALAGRLAGLKSGEFCD